MILHKHDVPVAYSMVEIASRVGDSTLPLFYHFACYWMAFNNIYVTVADRREQRVTFKTLADGTIRTRRCGHVDIPEVQAVTERDQIDLAVGEFSNDLMHQLVTHPSAQFFAYRTPCWRGQRIECDTTGQRLNGVLNVGHTVDFRRPVWSPLDTGSYEQYIGGIQNAATRNELAKQIISILYTVRNNTFHGGKRVDDANDLDVLEKALPLLKMVVESFMEVGSDA